MSFWSYQNQFLESTSCEVHSMSNMAIALRYALQCSDITIIKFFPLLDPPVSLYLPPFFHIFIYFLLTILTLILLILNILVIIISMHLLLYTSKAES